MSLKSLRTINWSLLLPLLFCGALVQITVPLARIYTSYAAIAMDLPSTSLGLLSSAFALLPVFLAISIGRYNDRHGEILASVLGASMVLFAVIGLAFIASNLAALLAFTSMLGIGQVLVIAATQMVTTRCSQPDQHDTVLGYFLLATSLGQALGPLLITATTPAGALTPGTALPLVILASGAVLLVGSIVMASRLPPHQSAKNSAATSLRALLGTRALLVIIIASSLTVTANDLMLVFFPALGAERGIAAGLVGILLAGRAAASISSRILFARLAALLGRPMLLTASMIVGSLAMLGLVLDLPVWAMALLLCLSGFAVGLATAASISLALSLAPDGARATTISLRLTANRVGQFIIPVAAGSTTAVLGATGVFAFIGMAMLLSALSNIRMDRLQ